MVVYNSLTDRTDAGALIPEDVATEIIQGLPATSAAMSMFRRVRMARGQQRQPVLSALPVAYWVDGDTGLKQTSEQLWGNQYLDARELAVIVPIPDAVLDDAAFPIWDEVRPRITEAIGQAIDSAAIFGVNSPSGWPDSIVEQAVAAGNFHMEGTSAAPHDDFAGDISDTMAKVEEDGFDVTGFWARRKVRARLRNLRDDNGQPIYQPVAAGSPATIYGEPVAFVSNGSWVNNYELVAGDANMAILAVRQDITFRIFTEGVISDGSGNVVLNLMQQDTAALRAVCRVAFNVANPINLENTNEDTRFPFAVLINAGS